MKPTTQSGVSPAPSTVERRAFIWKAGAALSGTLAAAAATGTADTTSKRVVDEARDAPSVQLERLSHQLGVLEDANAIRALHRALGHALNEGLHQDVINLFADASEVAPDGAVFILESTQEPGVVEVAPDRRTATARFHCVVKVAAPLPCSSPLVEMAQQQGQGMATWWEAGLYDNSYVKNDAGWKIQTLRYRPIERADPPTR
jgi:SnoaL-like domain